MVSYVLYLDDIRFPFDDGFFSNMKKIAIARSFEQFESIIKSEGLPSLVSFDFDLGQNNVETLAPTGGTAVRWLIEYCHVNNERFPQWRLHTANTEGRKEMESLIMSAFKAGYIFP